MREPWTILQRSGAAPAAPACESRRTEHLQCVGAGFKLAPHQAIEAGGAVVGDKIKITLHVEAIRQA
jgi:hypothetical protein